MSLYSISIWAAIVGVILLVCYALVRLIVKIEMKKSLPNQINSLKEYEYFKDKEFRVTFRIKSSGEHTLEHFDIVDKVEYVG